MTCSADTSIGLTLSDSPPAGLRLSNFDTEAAIRLVGEREFKDRCGWVAVYNPNRDHTGPKNLFKDGRLIRTSTT